jgi:hypothetical protein
MNIVYFSIICLLINKKKDDDNNDKGIIRSDTCMYGLTCTNPGIGIPSATELVRAITRRLGSRSLIR